MISTITNQQRTFTNESEGVVLETIEELLLQRSEKKTIPKTPLKTIGAAVKKYSIDTSRVVLLPKTCARVWGENTILIDPWKHEHDSALWTSDGFFRETISRLGFDCGQVVFPGKDGAYLWLQGAESDYEAKRRIVVISDASLKGRELFITQNVLENLWGRILHYGKVDTARRVEQSKKGGLRFDRP